MEGKEVWLGFFTQPTCFNSLAKEVKRRCVITVTEASLVTEGGFRLKAGFLKETDPADGEKATGTLTRLGGEIGAVPPKRRNFLCAPDSAGGSDNGRCRRRRF
jgi:hypothetical protein